MEKILEIQKNVKAIIRKHENNLIKLNVEVFRSINGLEPYSMHKSSISCVLKACSFSFKSLFLCLVIYSNKNKYFKN